MHRMQDFRMVLHGIKLSFFVLHGCNGAIFRMRRNFKACRDVGHVICMAHPDGFFCRQALKERRCRINRYRRFAEFTPVRPLYLPAEAMRHKLHAVAQSEYGDILPEYVRVDFRRVFFIYAVRAARKNNTARPKLLNLLNRFIIRVYLAVHVIFSDAARD